MGEYRKKYDEGLKKIRKGITISQLYKCVSDLKSTGLNKKAFLSFIIGFPWEGYNEMLITLETIENITFNYHVVCNINWLIFLPSDLWNERSLFGIDVDESLYDRFLWYEYSDYFFKCHPNITHKQYKEICKKLINMASQNEYIKINLPSFID